MALDSYLSDRATTYNAEQAAAGAFGVRVPPEGGRPPLFRAAGDPAFAEWVAGHQGRLALRADGALGPATLQRFRWAVLEAITKDASAGARASLPGWDIFDRIGFSLEGKATPPPGSAPTPAGPRPVGGPLAIPSSSSTPWLLYGGIGLVVAALLWRYTR